MYLNPVSRSAIQLLHFLQQVMKMNFITVDILSFGRYKTFHLAEP
jgi:hypothetical protein